MAARLHERPQLLAGTRDAHRGRGHCHGGEGALSGGSAFVATSGTQISDEGWYTMQHTFRDAGGVLAVDLTLLDRDGQVVYTTTRSDPADAMSGVGGNPLRLVRHEQRARRR